MPKLYIMRYKWAMLLSVILFVLGVLLGSVYAETVKNIIAGEVDKLRSVSEGLSDSKNPEMHFFIFIFLNNALKSVLVIWLGIAFGILPFIFLLLNGMAIGFVVENSAQAGGNITELIVKGLLPHGIIEIPALLIACAYGLQFGGLVWKSMLLTGSGRKTLGLKWREFVKAAGRATVWVVVLLVIAALIESTVTFHLVRN